MRTSKPEQLPLDTFARLSTFLLTLLFSYAAVSKLLDFGLFRAQMLNQDLPHTVASALPYLLPPAEILTALLLQARRTYFAGLALSFSLLLLFTGYIALVLLGFWDRVPCSCGGILSHMGWKVHLCFNLIFLTLSLIALLRAARRKDQQDIKYVSA